MQWLGRRESTNVDDRRGISGGPLAVGGGIVGVIFLLAKFLLGGGDVSDLQQVLPQQPGQAVLVASQQRVQAQSEQGLEQFRQRAHLSAGRWHRRTT